VGKGVIRFHAVYWPAMLLSAGLPLPTEILVHDYLTIDGRKISKSSGVTADPTQLVEQVGSDAVRWWLLREVPRVGDADFTFDRLVERTNAELAGGLGNLVHRTITMIHRYRGGVVPAKADSTYDGVSAAIDEALEDFDFRRATSAVWRIGRSTLLGPGSWRRSVERTSWMRHSVRCTPRASA
jgi:methionyl-tRNA synthetase